MKTEQRIYDLDALEVRADEETGVPTKIIGHAAVFNSLSVDLGGFREQIAPGAFANAITEKDDVRALWNHDPNLVLGRTPNTLTLSEDKTGLRMEIDLEGAPDHVRDLTKSIQRGDVNQASFAFNLRSKDGDKWHEDDEGATIRTLVDLRLSDVSPVTYPAYPETSVAMRSLEQYRELHEKVTAQVDDLLEPTMTVAAARTFAILRRHGVELP